VCCLHKSLYGLKQASRQWFAKFSNAILQFGFTQLKVDTSFFTHSQGTSFTVLFVYVDDVIIASNNSAHTKALKDYLDAWFHIKDLGPLKYFLGLEVARSLDDIVLSQGKYALDILHEASLLGSKPFTFPMEQNHKLALDDSAILDNPGAYRRLVGRLIYLTITRPNICYSVHILSQFMHQPHHGHWAAVIRVLRYLKSATGQGIFLPLKFDLQLHTYCDSDWAGCPVTRCSLTGYFITLGCSPISWKTKKQNTVSRSSIEAEYHSIATTTCEIIWLRTLLHDLMVPISSSAQLYCDNHGTIHIAANPVHHETHKAYRDRLSLYSGLYQIRVHCYNTHFF